MKIRSLLRAVASLAVAAAAVTAFGITSSAQVADFEDGNSSFVEMQTDDGGDLSYLSVVDFNGSKQLKVDVQDCSLIPKVRFDINAMVGTDNLSKIDKILMDVTIESKDGATPPGWIGGALGTAAGEVTAWNQSDYSGGEYENTVSEVIAVERKFLLPAHKYVDGTEGAIALLMRWASDVPYNMYIDNVRFLDKDGNELPLVIEAGAAAPAAAPASDAAAATTSTPTGNTSAAAVAAAMACAAAAAFAFRKRK